MREGKRSAARAKRFRLWALCWAGGATIELCDAWGNRSIIERLEPGEVFAEAYACLPGEPLMVSVTGGRAHARDVSGRQPHAVDGA